MGDILNLWVIYAFPLDYPGHFVVRRHVARYPEPSGPTNECSIHETLEDARDAVPRGLVRLERDPNDDPAIYEVWI